MVLNASKEGFVDKIGRIQIGRKDYECLERQMELLSGLQREIVDSAFERDNPSVQQVARRRVLATEIVNHQDAAVGERLQWRAVQTGRRKVPELQRFQSELPADSDTRTAASDPSVVHVRLALQGERIFVRVRALVNDGVEHPDDVTVNRQRVWNRNIAGQNVANRFRDDGLAVSWRPVHEKGMPCGDGGAELVEHSIAEHEVRECPLNRLSRHAHWVIAHKATHVLEILFKRNRYVADVLAVLEQQHGAGTSRLGQPIAVGRRTYGAAASDSQ